MGRVELHAMIGYKLTDNNGYTRHGLSGETLWSVGVTVSPVGTYAGKPCGPGCLHFYSSADEASLYDPIHATYGLKARLFEIEVSGDPKTDGLKWWTTAPVRVTRELPLSAIDTSMRVAWAICLAPHLNTRYWAINWLSGTDRTARGAELAWVAVSSSARAARASSAAEAAASAASSSARAARASSAAEAAASARAARGAREAEAAAAAARAAARAAEASSVAAAVTDFPAWSMAALNTARRILAGDLSAEQYDAET